MEPTSIYRVVGVRHGGVRVTLSYGLTLDRAEFVKMKLSGVIAFQELVIEPDDQPEDAAQPCQS